MHAGEWRRRERDKHLLAAAAQPRHQRRRGPVCARANRQRHRQRQEAGRDRGFRKRREQRQDDARGEEAAGDVPKLLVAALRAVGHEVAADRREGVGHDRERDGAQVVAALGRGDGAVVAQSGARQQVADDDRRVGQVG